MADMKKVDNELTIINLYRQNDYLANVALNTIIFINFVKKIKLRLRRDSNTGSPVY